MCHAMNDPFSEHLFTGQFYLNHAATTYENQWYDIASGVDWDATNSTLRGGEASM